MWQGLLKSIGENFAEDEVLEVTGYRVGTVSPFGLKNPVKVLIDDSVLKEEEVSIGSGVRSVAIIMKSADIQRALGEPEIVSLLETS